MESIVNSFVTVGQSQTTEEKLSTYDTYWERMKRNPAANIPPERVYATRIKSHAEEHETTVEDVETTFTSIEKSLRTKAADAAQAGDDLVQSLRWEDALRKYSSAFSYYHNVDGFAWKPKIYFRCLNDMLVKMARVELEMKNVRSAKEIMLRVKDLDGDESIAEILERMSQIYSELGQFVEAQECLYLAQKLCPAKKSIRAALDEVTDKLVDSLTIKGDEKQKVGSHNSEAEKNKDKRRYVGDGNSSSISKKNAARKKKQEKKQERGKKRLEQEALEKKAEEEKKTAAAAQQERVEMERQERLRMEAEEYERALAERRRELELMKQSKSDESVQESESRSCPEAPFESEVENEASQINFHVPEHPLFGASQSESPQLLDFTTDEACTQGEKQSMDVHHSFEDGCIICMAAERGAIVLPCSHLSMCIACTTDVLASSHPDCPICRQPIISIIKLNLA